MFLENQSLKAQMDGSQSGRTCITSRKSEFVVSLEMCMGKLFNRGRRGYLKYFVAIVRRISGILMILESITRNWIWAERKACRGGKKSKQRITVAFFVTANGEKEKPVVIWHSENPRCLKRFDKTVLPVAYYSQKNSWMTGELMEAILTKLNSRLAHTN